MGYISDKSMWSVRIATAVSVIAAALCGCKDKSADPPQVKDYPAYFCQPDYDQKLFVFHPTTRRIDSTEINWQPVNGITVSADGQRLYLAQTNSVVVVNAQSLALIAELPYVSEWPVAVSPDNRYVAFTGDDLHILKTDDYSLIFSDTDETENGIFSSDSRTFYCAAGWSPQSVGVVYKVDLSDSLFPVTRLTMDDGGVVHVIPSQDESMLFIYVKLPPLWHWAFEVYNVALDSVVFRDLLIPGAGQAVLSPDESFVAYTNPGRTGTDIPTDFSLRFYDVAANAIDTVIADTNMFTGDGWGAPPNRMVMTPDGRWLVIIGGQMSLGILYLYDIEKRQLVHREDFGGPVHWFTSPTVQLSK